MSLRRFVLAWLAAASALAAIGVLVFLLVLLAEAAGLWTMIGVMFFGGSTTIALLFARGD